MPLVAGMLQVDHPVSYYVTQELFWSGTRQLPSSFLHIMKKFQFKIIYIVLTDPLYFKNHVCPYGKEFCTRLMTALRL